MSTNLPFTFLTLLILFSIGLLVSCNFRLGHFLWLILAFLLLFLGSHVSSGKIWLPSFRIRLIIGLIDGFLLLPGLLFFNLLSKLFLLIEAWFRLLLFIFSRSLMLFLGTSFGVVIFLVLNGVFLVGQLFVGLKRRVVLVFDQLSWIVKHWLLKFIGDLDNINFGLILSLINIFMVLILALFLHFLLKVMAQWFGILWRQVWF